MISNTWLKKLVPKKFELLKQTDACPFGFRDSFKRFSEEKIPEKECLYSSLKNGTTDLNGEKLQCHISDKDGLKCNQIWNKFNMKNMSDYHDYYFKKEISLLADVLKSLLTRA